ncbi:iron ABC transporter permease [uncultured Aquitalea sp.]|uniref:FecCD family ABC transporter permease n=1 Tax=uncultured Aquitalea sp. TaxID=540272 RepID=UPI0025E82C9E|nr:iron ABC transporter permease [uncultured Aquitalea sp.]
MRPILLLVPLAILLTATAALSLLGVHGFGQLASGAGLPPLEWHLIRELRLPRVLAAAAAGALLSAAGCAVQARFRNPLAEPGLIGINSGAALAAALALALGAGMGTVFMSAFAGGMLALLAIRLLGRAHRDSVRLILAGLAVSTILGSLLTLLISLLPDGALRSVTFWLMGSFAGADWPQALTLALAAPAVWLLLYRRWPLLNALQLGNDAAFHLGFDVKRGEWQVTTLAALAAGFVVAACGMVGFVGLMAPHLTRQLVGGDAKRLLQAAPLTGALLTVLADWLARSVIAPAELPVGVITSLIGAPFFLWLLQQDGKHHA